MLKEGRKPGDVVVVEFAFEGDHIMWNGLVDFSESPTGQFDEAVNGSGEVLYVHKMSLEEKFALELIVLLARDYHYNSELFEVLPELEGQTVHPKLKLLKEMREFFGHAYSTEMSGTVEIDLERGVPVAIRQARANLHE
jgi:hypothetical protein